MRFAYVITLFKQPHLFRRLLDALWCSNDIFALHVDAKTSKTVLADFKAAAAGRPNIHFIEPVRVTWGGYGLSEAEFRAFEWLIRKSGKWDYVFNITGQDFPLKPRGTMINELEQRPGAVYMHAEDVSELPDHIRLRSNWVYLEFRDRLYRLPIPKPQPCGFRNNWKGHGFHILSYEFCKWLIDTPLMMECRSFFQRTLHPHEQWLQAMAMASPFRDQIVPDNKRMIDFEPDAPHPKIMTSADLPNLLTSDAFFARKFDETVDQNVISTLEHRLRAQAAVGPADRLQTGQNMAETTGIAARPIFRPFAS